MHGYYSELQWNICLIQLSGFIILHFHTIGNVKSVSRLNNSRKKDCFALDQTIYTPFYLIDVSPLFTLYQG